MSWVKFAGVDPKLFPPKPVYEKELPTIHDSDQIDKLLNTDNKYMRMVMLVALKLGLRDQELRYVEFSDINKQEKTLQGRYIHRYRSAVPICAAGAIGHRRCISCGATPIEPFSVTRMGASGHKVAFGTRGKMA